MKAENITKIQIKWRYYKYHRFKKIIIDNYYKIYNYIDPLSLNYFIRKSKIININNLYIIKRNDIIYLYEINTLNKLIDENYNEIYTNTTIRNNEKNEIKFLYKSIKFYNTVNLSNSEIIHLKKTKVFQIFNELNTYFSLQLYENIDKIKIKQILNELKLMWYDFKNRYNLNENELFNKQLHWNNNDTEYQLLENILIMIDNNLEFCFKKNISFIIIGAFCYVDEDLKKIYNNIDFE